MVRYQIASSNIKKEQMKQILERKSWVVLLFSAFFTGFISCDSGDDSDKNTEIKQKLVGEWRLVSSTIEGEAVGTEDFSYLKASTATFNTDNTYEVIYKKRNGNSSSTSILSGTYTVNDVNSITFFNSTSEIELIAETLQITSITEDNKTQVDIFIRKDNEEFMEDEESSENVIDGDEDDNSNPPTPSYDGSAVIAQIQGFWEITNVSHECQKKNTLEFVGPDKVIFTQHKKTFNRNDLLNYNISVSYPLQSDFSAVVTKGFNSITFDNNADCQFIKESKLNYLVEDAETIIIKESSKLTFKIIDSSTINLIYKYEDENSNEQIIQFVYAKT